MAVETTGENILSSNYENISIAISPVNDPPNVPDITWYGTEDQSSTIELIGDDPDGDLFAYSIDSVFI